MAGRIIINDGKYVHVWRKYRPAILSLMVASSNEEQTYKLSNHEFMDISPNKVSGYAFLLRVHKGRVINDIKTSLLAPDLLYVLKNSGKALELSETAIYEFEMEKNFTLHIRCEQLEPEEDTENESVESDKDESETEPKDEGKSDQKPDSDTESSEVKTDSSENG